MRTIQIGGTITALSSISHIGENSGNESELYRERFVQPDGRVEDVPVITGGSIRGILRDVSCALLLRQLGYGPERPLLNKPAFYFLSSGGSLTAKGGRTLNANEAKRLAGLIPHIALFGGGAGNEILPGILKVGKAIPICKQTAHLLPSHLANGPTPDVYTLINRERYTRRDDSKQGKLAAFLPAPAAEQAALPEGRVSLKLLDVPGGAVTERKRPEAKKETGESEQMIFYVQTLAAGTRFAWDITLMDPTPLELACFAAVMDEWLRLPILGGKSAVGLGRVKLDLDAWVELGPTSRPPQSMINDEDVAAYQQHVEANAATIRSELEAWA